MRDTLESFLAVFFVAIIFLVGLAIVIVVPWIILNHVYAGTVVEYEGTVQTVTRNSFLAPNTRVVLRTYSEDYVSFTLGGYHDFEIGASYKIRMTMKPYLYGLVCWGKIMDPISIERLGAEG